MSEAHNFNTYNAMFLWYRFTLTAVSLFLSGVTQKEPGESAMNRFAVREGNLWVVRNLQTLVTGAALLIVAGLSWLLVIRQASEMPGMSMEAPGMAMAEGSSSSILTEATAYLVAWGVMMAAMMLPSATPMITLYGTIHRKRTQSRDAGVSVALFTLIYLIVWLAFGIPVYLLGVVIDGSASTSPAVAGLLPYALAIVLLAAGIYQLSPLKRVCLQACRSPLGFLMGHWQSGYLGTIKMGLAHAAYCVGCCWSLMVVLVAAGAMALHWVLLITVLVFAEKLFPHGEWTARAIGTALIVVGTLVILWPDLAATW